MHSGLRLSKVSLCCHAYRPNITVLCLYNVVDGSVEDDGHGSRLLAGPSAPETPWEANARPTHPNPPFTPSSTSSITSSAICGPKCVRSAASSVGFQPDRMRRYVLTCPQLLYQGQSGFTWLASLFLLFSRVHSRTSRYLYDYFTSRGSSVTSAR